MTPPVLYLAGTGHTGSTLVALLLGAHPQVVSLGEVVSVIDQVRTDTLPDRPCSCGQALTDCAFWGPVLTELRRSAPASLEEAYRIVLAGTDRLGDRTDEPRWVVDASKHTRGLRALHSAGADLAVLHLARDVRAWAVAMQRRNARRGDDTLRGQIRHHGARGVSRWVRQRPVGWFGAWKATHRDIDRTCRELGLPAVEVGYDELALAPETVLGRICATLDLTWDRRVLRPTGLGSHVALGNRMADDPKAREAIRYDDRWRADRSWRLAARLRPGVVRDSDRRAHGIRTGT